MSNFREKAREIKAAGEAERSNFEPSGAPLSIYKYWAKHSTNAPVRENFCHFWRVVAIWAPLMFFRKKIVRPVARTKSAPWVLGALLIAFVSLGAYASVDFRMIVGVILACTVVVAAGFGLVYFLVERASDKTRRAVEKVFIVLLAVVAIAATVAVHVGLILDFGWIALAWEAGGIAAAAALVFTLVKVAEFISGRRAIKRDRRIEIETEWVRTGEGPCPWEPKGPGALRKFFSGVADFLILITQIARVKKWKICPGVKI